MHRVIKLFSLVVILTRALSSYAYSDIPTAFEPEFGESSKNQPTRESLLPSEKQQLKIPDSFSEVHHVVIKAEDFRTPRTLPPISDLSVMVFDKGELQPIPFQFDEFDETGQLYFEGVTKNDVYGKLGHYDLKDELVFMYRDMGSRLDQATVDRESFHILQEIAIGTGKSTKYAYLVQGDSQRSNRDYIHVDLPNGRIWSKTLDIVNNPKDFTEIKEFHIAGEQDSSNIIKDLFLDISTGIFNKKLRVSLNTKKNIIAKPIAVKDGPVRATVLLLTKIKYAGIPVFKDKISINYHEQAINLPSRFAVDSVNATSLFTLFLKEPKIEFKASFQNLKGAHVLLDSIANDQACCLVDGKMSILEHEINKRRLPGDWLMISSNQGWNAFFSNSLPVEPDGLFDSFLEGMEIEIKYNDVPSNEGAIDFGVEAVGIPKIAINMMSSIGKVDFSKVNNAAELIDQLITLNNKRKLKKLDKAFASVLSKMKNEGKIHNTNDLAISFIKDFNRIGLKGMDREDLNKVIYQSVAKFERIEDFSVGQFLENIKSSANEHDFDLNKLNYAFIDNTLWFPNSGLISDPHSFYRSSREPPQISFPNREDLQESLKITSQRNYQTNP